ncbi:MAG: hypothetical protein M0Q26_05715 [Chitinophagaceae bacterium]|nr:hypothetical protein [Chitinophagaceae bacterium]
MPTKKDSHWIPLADLMTVLMIIFLFMAISYIIDVTIQDVNRHVIPTNIEVTVQL